MLFEVIVSPELIICIAVLVVAALLPWAVQTGMLYVVIPWRERANAIHPYECSYRSVLLDELPAELAADVLAAATQLPALGFTAAEHYSVEQPICGTDFGFVSVWFNRECTASAHIIATRVPYRAEALQGQSVCFVMVSIVTEFTDGSAIVTANTGNVPVLLREHNVNSLRAPGVRDLSLLVRLHHARVQHDRGERAPFLPDASRLVEHMNKCDRRQLDHNCRGGYVYFDTKDQMYRRTLRGLFCSYWRLLWPWRSILEQQNQAKLERTISMLGIGHPHEYLPSPYPGTVATQVLDYELPVNSRSPVQSPDEATRPASS